MSRDTNIALAHSLLADIGQGKDPDDIAGLFSPNLRFEIQGDEGVLPWIGYRFGRQAAADFFRDIRALTEPVRFDVDDILASDRRAVIVGELATRIKANNRVTHSQFAIILTTANGKIARFQMIENSFDLSRTVRGSKVVVDVEP